MKFDKLISAHRCNDVDFAGRKASNPPSNLNTGVCAMLNLSVN